MMKIYLAGGMQSGWQEKVRAVGPEARYLDPSTHGLQDERQYTTWDLHAIRACDVLFVYFETDNPSGYGLSLEAGYAHALGKTIVLVDEKTAADPVTGQRLGMLRTVADVVFTDLDSGIEFLHSLKRAG